MGYLQTFLVRCNVTCLSHLMSCNRVRWELDSFCSKQYSSSCTLYTFLSCLEEDRVEAIFVLCQVSYHDTI